MKKRVVILLLLCSIVWGCAEVNLRKCSRSYDKFMNQAEALAEVLCKHSEFSVCYWEAVLGDDINKLPAEALNILSEIEQITKGKSVEDLTECEKGKLLGLWKRFAYLVSKDVIKRVVPFMIKFAGVL
ncbi:hypothetical protein DRO59_00140 [Candidatus Bathyarchaeota archaeon]|nr:MAG: hypothetical protein DRO59_00140 [Candidatus Bathyarchaeota archaeon]